MESPVTMELKDFVKQTLISIASAIKDANEELKDLDAVANPRNAEPSSNPNSQNYGAIFPGHVDRYVHSVDFDIAVYASEGKETKGGMGVIVAAVALGSQGRSDSSHSSESRIRFTLPFQFPAGGN